MAWLHEDVRGFEVRRVQFRGAVLDYSRPTKQEWDALITRVRITDDVIMYTWVDLGETPSECFTLRAFVVGRDLRIRFPTASDVYLGQIGVEVTEGVLISRKLNAWLDASGSHVLEIKEPYEYADQ